MTAAPEAQPSLAPRIALWCARRRRWVVPVWLLIVVAAIGTCSTVPVDTDIEQEGVGESGEAAALLEERFGGGDEAEENDTTATTSEFLTFSHPTLRVDDAQYRAKVEGLIAELRLLRDTATETAGATSVTSSTRIVADVVTHYDTGLPREASPFVAVDGAGGDVSFAILDVVGVGLDAAIEPVIEAVGAADGTDGFEIFIGGGHRSHFSSTRSSRRTSGGP